jgi:hypothetical protein
MRFAKQLRVFRRAALSILLISITGCVTLYSNADHEFGAPGARLLHRDYVVTSTTPFALAKTHLLPVGLGWPYNLREPLTVDLDAGTVFHTEFIQHYWSFGICIDGDVFDFHIVQAIVATGPKKGTRIGIVYDKLCPPLKIAARPVNVD